MPPEIKSQIFEINLIASKKKFMKLCNIFSTDQRFSIDQAIVDFQFNSSLNKTTKCFCSEVNKKTDFIEASNRKLRLGQKN